MESLLTVEQTARRLQLSPLTVQRQLKRGVLRGIKHGRVWRVPESALLESSSPHPQALDTPQVRAATILADLDSGNPKRRLNAIRTLARADASTYELVEAGVQRAEAAYSGPQDDMSDWRALEGEPFHFPEERGDFLSRPEENATGETL